MTKTSKMKEDMGRKECGCSGRMPSGSKAEVPPPPMPITEEEARTPRVKRTPKQPTPEEIEAYEAKIKEKTPTARRTYILVRHGQYEMKETDEERILTALGREQANLAGERLSSLWKHKQLSGRTIIYKYIINTNV